MDQKTELTGMMVLLNSIAYHTKHSTCTCPDSGPQCSYSIAVGCLDFTRLEAPLVGDSGRPLLAVLSLYVAKISRRAPYK